MFEQYGATFILYDLVFLDLFVNCIIFFSVHSISLYIFLSLIMLIILPLTLLLLHEQGLKHLICYISLLCQGCKKQNLGKIIISFSFCPRFAKYLNLAKHWQYFFFSLLDTKYQNKDPREQKLFQNFKVLPTWPGIDQDISKNFATLLLPRSVLSQLKRGAQ